MTQRSEMEKLWRHEKYLVMYHSQNHYNQIREALKTDCDLNKLESLIEDAKKVTPTKGSIINAYQHMWGYFKKMATDEEKAAYHQSQQVFSDNEWSEETLLDFIRSLAMKYDVKYLLNSSVLDQNQNQ